MANAWPNLVHPPTIGPPMTYTEMQEAIAKLDSVKSNSCDRWPARIKRLLCHLSPTV